MPESPQRWRDRVASRLAGWHDSPRRGLVPPLAILTRGWVLVLTAVVLGAVYLQGEPRPTPVERIALQQPAGLVQTLWLGPGGALRAASRLDGMVRLWRADAGSGQAESSATAVEGRVAELSPDGTILAVGGDSTLAFWETTSAAPRQTVPTEAGLTTALAFSRDGATLALAGERGVTLWDTASGSRRAEWEPRRVPRGVKTVAFAPDGRLLATGGQDGFIRLWNVETGREQVAIRAHGFHVSSLSFSADGRAVASGCYGEPNARLWDMATGRALASLRGHSGMIQAVAFAPGGEIVATAGLDGLVRLWDATTGRQRVSLSYGGLGIKRIAFSADGRSLAGGGYEPAVWVWDLSGIRASRPTQAAEHDVWLPHPSIAAGGAAARGLVALRDDRSW